MERFMVDPVGFEVDLGTISGRYQIITSGSLAEMDGIMAHPRVLRLTWGQLVVGGLGSTDWHSIFDCVLFYRDFFSSGLG